MEKISGSCLCGKITFELDRDFKQFHLCHCTQCQKTSGSAHVSNLFTRPDNIFWLSGEELIRRFDVPGRSITNAYCDHCGCAVPYVSNSGKALVVPAGSLDGDPGMTPQDHIFWAERAAWYEAGMDVPHFDGFPE
ncbi:aldehyde-activating protein [Hahella sp. CCB-MM4]|uniref:GFA family protein n=1 Tax=Hahella sp. (strain CCB-MM4) TaxID=1926491 RepID=UPI000B9BBCE4|nr:GFA family protein [Hahella sp. CCB-MM4]OZG73821.1 aldehyde-activating protein [Hahella sp. CCB-MM4]